MRSDGPCRIPAVTTRPLHAIGLVVAAVACFAALDSATKAVSHAVPLAMAVWFRYLFQALVTGIVLGPRRGRGLVRTRHPVLHFVRGATLVGSSAIAFLSLRYMPMGEYTAIVMLTPLVITVIAALQFGERVSWRQWLLVGGGFLGAMVVIRPGADDFSWAMLLPLCIVATNAAFQLITSRLAKVDDAGTMHFTTGCVGAALATLALPFGWQMPSPGVWLLLLMVGVFSTLGHYLLILAYGRAPAATLTPYLYLQIAFATLFGWIVFGHAPDAWAIAGIGLIGLCGAAGTRQPVHPSPK